MKRAKETAFLVLGVCVSALGCGGGAANKADNPAEPLPGKQAKAIVYFTEDISPEGLVKIYDKVGANIKGKTAIKIHTGEPNGPNIIPRDMVKALQAHVPDSNLVETNTYYKGARHNTKDHLETIKTNGWDFCEVDIMDADGAVMLPIKGGKHFKEMSVGKNLLNYDSMIALTHFKGHTMGGFGGSLKNISIGCADGKIGKKMMHEKSMQSKDESWSVSGAAFQENMAEGGKAVADYFGDNIVYINVLRNMSVDCDCAGVSAAEPKTRNIGILASTDILAVDQASVDMVYALPDEESHDLKERIESREGLRQLSYMKELGMGNNEYELVNID